MAQIESITINEKTVCIHSDRSLENPRVDYDYTSTLAINGFGGDIKAEDPPADSIYLPVYFYRHGGVAYKATPFHCPWDSGLTGYIWESRKNIREEFGVKRVSPKLRQTILKRLKTEIEEVSLWANGEIYGYVIEETEESCFGFFGYDAVIEAAREATAS